MSDASSCLGDALCITPIASYTALDPVPSSPGLTNPGLTSPCNYAMLWHMASVETRKRRKDQAGWEIEVCWYWEKGRPAPSGPHEVTIRPTSDVSPTDLQRGITTTVMRRVERIVTELHASGAWRTPGEMAAEQKYRAALAQSAASLPKSPRTDPDAYYAGLLHLFDVIDATSAKPINELADLLEIPKNTVKTRLRNARQRQAKSKQ